MEFLGVALQNFNFMLINAKKHCNFFVNKGSAKSSDLEKLIYKVKSEVLDKTGINLELELQIIGEKL